MMNRRKFVSTLGQGSLGAMMGLTAMRAWAQAPGHELPIDCSPPAPPGPATHITFNTSIPVLPRKSVWDLNSDEVTRLQNAYQALRSLSTSNPSDPRGWMQQANVHCFNCSGGYDMSDVEIHGGYWFMPWHRCYLHVHERILGNLIGDPTFRLAYWDWDTYPSHSVVPPTFMLQGSLLDSYRGAGPADTIPLGITDPATMAIVMGTQGTSAFMGGVPVPPNFPNAGAMENGPHGAVHLWTGDPNPGQQPEPPGCSWPNNQGGTAIDQSPNCLDMGVLATAAQDPIFFSHHSNIDRLWDVWLQTPGSQGNYNDPNWLNHPFNFYDENGNWIYITVADVIAQQEQANLRYAYQPPQTTAPLIAKRLTQVRQPKPKAVKPLVVASTARAIRVGTKPHVRSIAVPPAHRNNLKLLAAGGARGYELHIDGLTLPPNESALVNVFVGAPNAKSDTPVGPSYVGTFSILVSGSGHKHPTVRNALFELRPETAALLLKQKMLRVSLVPKLINGKEPKKSSLTYKRIYLTQR
jgi:polyphenol oxidase